MPNGQMRAFVTLANGNNYKDNNNVVDTTTTNNNNNSNCSSSNANNNDDAYNIINDYNYDYGNERTLNWNKRKVKITLIDNNNNNNNNNNDNIDCYNIVGYNNDIINGKISINSTCAKQNRRQQQNKNNNLMNKLYNKHFQRNGSTYKEFDSVGDNNIQRLVHFFKDFDVVNAPMIYKKFNFEENQRMATYADHCIVHQYLVAKEFNPELLKNIRYDHVVNAIISFVLPWSNNSIDQYIEYFPIDGEFLKLIREYRQLDNGKYVFTSRNVPFIRTAFKLLKRYFQPEKISKFSFNWVNSFNKSFIKHLNEVYSLLINDAFTYEWTHKLETPQPIPYILPNVSMDNLKKPKNITFKFITGQACCCKTSILNKLESMGWRKFSRGDVGSFSGKSSSPAAIGNMHAALNAILTLPNVIGDRGFIDNVIWSFIMPACDMTHRDHFIMNMLNFLDSNFNEPAIMEYISQKGVIFIDPYPELNRQRQLNRSESGDAHRARIFMYPIAQFMMYYTIGVLFGWKIICVPYTRDRKFDNDRFNANLNSIIKYFGMPERNDVITNLELRRFAKPSNAYTFDNAYPMANGIFK